MITHGASEKNGADIPFKASPLGEHLIRIGPSGLSHNRVILGLTNVAEACTWIPGDNITELTVLCVTDGGVVVASDIIGVVFDAPSAAVAAMWLTETESLASDSMIEYIKPDVERIFRFEAALSNAYFIRLAGGGTYRCAIGAK